jgi:hypothetical protein
MGTVHCLADLRAGKAAVFAGGDSPASAPDPGEPAEWELLAERAERAVSALEAAAADPRHGADLAGLAAEVAGLRFALTAASARQVAVKAVAEGGYLAATDAERQGRRNRER